MSRLPLIRMFDTTEVRTVPHWARAVAGYTDGHYQTYQALRHAFPNAHHLSITVFGGVADCVDIEPGNPVHPDQAGRWVRSMHRHNVWRPCIYADESHWPAINDALHRAGLHWPADFRRWVAAWNNIQQVPHGYDAHQFADNFHGTNVDQSVVLGNFFVGQHHH